MGSNAQIAVHLKELIAEIRAVVAKWRGERAAAPSKAKSLGAAFTIFRRAWRFRESTKRRPRQREGQRVIFCQGGIAASGAALSIA